MHTHLRRNFVRTAALMGLLIAAPVWAQTSYPDHPIRMVVPFAAGGAVDSLARIVAMALSTELGQQVIVDTRTGATGHIGGEAVARAAPDGYTVLLTASSAQVVSAQLLKLNYKPMEDLTPVALLTTVSNIMVVNKDLPVKTVAEFIAYAKANPGKVSYGSHGLGSNSHLAGEMFTSMAGVDLVHVPYSSPQLLPDLLTGRVQVLLGNITELEQYMKNGDLRALALTGPKRLPEFPQMPTVAETLPGYSIGSWGMLMAPAKTPAAIVTRLNAAANKVLARTDVQEAFAKLRFNAAPLDVAQTREFLQSEAVRWGRVIRDAKVPMLN